MRCRTLILAAIFLNAILASQAAESCVTIHGRLHMYCGDGQLRIWHIGTHHDFTPDETSFDKVVGWLEERATESDKREYACYAGANDLYADFLICPTEPFKKGSVQAAKVVSAIHRHYVHAH